MKRIALLLLTLSLILAVALPAAAAGGPHGRRHLRRQALTARRVRNHHMFIDETRHPVIFIPPVTQRLPTRPTPCPTRPEEPPQMHPPQLPVRIPGPLPPISSKSSLDGNWARLSRRMSELSKRLSRLSRSAPKR